MWLLVCAQIVVGTIVVAFCPPQWHPWALAGCATVITGIYLALTRGFGNLRWPSAPLRRAEAVEIVDLVSPEHDHVGCVLGQRIVTTAVALEAGSHSYTTIDGAQRQSTDNNLGEQAGTTQIPLTLLAEQLNHAGPLLDGIDVVTESRRAAPTHAGDIYLTLVGSLPLVARRRTIALLRFDLTAVAAHGSHLPRAELAPESIAATSPPSPSSDTDRLIAVATERIRRAIVHHGYMCRVVEAPELAAYYRRSIASSNPEGQITVTVGAGARPDRVLDTLRGVTGDSITEVTRIRHGALGVPAVAATAELVGVPREVLDESRRDLRGCRISSGASARPIPGERVPAPLRSAMHRALPDRLDQLSPPACGAGQIFGATTAGHALVLPLAGPHLRSVLVAASPVVCRQIVFRAVASGLTIGIVTDSPSRWEQLTGHLEGEGLVSWNRDTGRPPADLDAVVWDIADVLNEAHIDSLAAPGGADMIPPTVIRIIPAGTPETNTEFEAALAVGPSLVIDGRIEGWLSIESATTEPTTVRVVSVAGEDPLVGLAHPTPVTA